MKAKYNRGFTLIELLVVIAIIGILASVVLASLNTARQKSRDAKRVSDVKQLQLALELYFDSNAGYPQGSSWSTDLVPTYIPVLPKPPTGTTNTAYLYAGLATGCTDYHLGVELEDESHTALSGDADAAIDAAAETDCDSGAGVDFTGGGSESNGDDATTPIYDLVP